MESGSITLHEGVTLEYGIAAPDGHTVAEYLAPGTAYSAEGNVVNGYVQETEQTLTVVSHQSHEPDINGKCACGLQSAASVTSDGNEMFYDSLQAAVSEALKQSGSTVKLLRDSTLPEGTNLYLAGENSRISLTIDWNGYTVIGSTSNDLLVVTDNADVTLRGSGSLINDAGQFPGAAVGIYYSGNLTILGGTYSPQVRRNSSATGTVQISGGVFKNPKGSGKSCAIYTDNGTIADMLAPVTAFAKDAEGKELIDAYSVNMSESYTTVYAVPHTHEVDEDGFCVCGFQCLHETLDGDSVCTVCGQLIAAEGTDADGKTLRYTSLQTAMNDPNTVSVKVLADDQYVDSWEGNSRHLTLDMNKKDVTFREIFSGTLTIKTENKGGYIYLDVQTIEEDARVVLDSEKILLVSDDATETVQLRGKLTIRAAEVGKKLVVASGGELEIFDGNIESICIQENAKVTLSGGYYNYITREASAPGWRDILAEEYGFVQVSSGEQFALDDSQMTLPHLNMEVKRHTNHVIDRHDCRYCNYTCNHNWVDGVCAACGLRAGIRGRYKSEPIDFWCVDLADALDGVLGGWDYVTLTLLEDAVLEDTTLDHGAFVLDLNGKTISGGQLTITTKANAVEPQIIIQGQGKVDTPIVLNGSLGEYTDPAFNGTAFLGGTYASITYSKCILSQLCYINHFEFLNDRNEWVAFERAEDTLTNVTAVETPVYITSGVAWRITTTYGETAVPDLMTNLTLHIADGYTVTARWVDFNDSSKVVAETVLTASGPLGSHNFTTVLPVQSDPYMLQCELTAVRSGMPDYALTKDKDGTAWMDVIPATVPTPTLPSKTYTGENLTADVPVSTLYTVQSNPGGVNAGNYDVVLELTDSTNYQWDEQGGKAAFQITPADLADAEIRLREDCFAWFNGNNPVFHPDPETGKGISQTQKIEVTFGGKTLTEDTDFTITGNVEADAGEHTLTITAKENGNFTGTNSAKWRIVPLTLDNIRLTEDSAKKVYDGTKTFAEPQIGSLQANWIGELMSIQGIPYEILSSTGELPSADAGQYNIDVQIQIKDANYVFRSGSDTHAFRVPVSVTKAPAPKAYLGQLTIANGIKREYTFEMNGLLPPPESGKTYGEITFRVKEKTVDSSYWSLYGDLSVTEDGILTLPIQAENVTKEGLSGTITVEAQSTNFEPILMTVDTRSQNKQPITGSPTLSSASITYGERISGIKLSGTMSDGSYPVTGTFCWDAPDTVPTAVGTYEAAWTFTPDSYLHETAKGTAAITVERRPVTVDGIRGKDRIYDGTKNVDLDYSKVKWKNKLDGDELTITADGEMDANYPGTRRVFLSNLTLGGLDADKYVLAPECQKMETTADISPRVVTVSGITAQDKVYDGSVEAVLCYDQVTIENLVAGDILTVNATGTFEKDANAGENKTVSIAGLTLVRNDFGRYILAESGNQTSTTAAITPREITVSGITAQSRFYDGTTKVTSFIYEKAVLAGKLEKDDLTVTAYGYFIDAKAGENKTVEFAGFVLGGGDAGNYALAASGQQSETTGTITPLPVRIFGTTVAESKVYNGSDLVTITNRGTLDGILGNDDVSIADGLSAHYADANAGTDKKVTFQGFALSGRDAGNYILASYQKFTTASITPKDITVTITPNGGTYGGEIRRAEAKLDGLILLDFGRVPVTLTYTGTANDGTEVNSTTVPTQAGSYTVTAAIENGNYRLTGNTQADFTIEKAAVPVPDAGTAVYDGQPHRTALVDTELYTVAAQDSTDVGSTDVVLTLKDTANYKWADGEDRTVILQFTIGKSTTNRWQTKPSITDCTYGEVPAVNPGEAVFGNVSVEYLTQDGKTLGAEAPTDAGNYQVRFAVAETENYNGVSETLIFSIAPKDIGEAIITLGDQLTYNGKEQTQTVAAVTVDGLDVTYDISGATETDAGNHTLTLTGTGNFTGSKTAAWAIARKNVTMTAAVRDKTYDGARDAVLETFALEGAVTGDEVTLNPGTARFVSAKIGENIPVEILGAALEGADAGNYRLTVPTNLTAAITASRNTAAVPGDTGLKEGDQVLVGGITATIETTSDGETILKLPEGQTLDSQIIQTFAHGTTADGKPYPTGMQAWRAETTEAGTTLTHIPELDNLLIYSGCSIRLSGTKGIRMITSLTDSAKAALTGAGLAGYTLEEYGTLVCWASDVANPNELTLDKGYARSNYAYRKGVSDPVFANINGLTQYTNVLVGFSLEDCKKEMVMRPYIKLLDAQGNPVVLYGGTVQRSIGYIAKQNENTYKPGTEGYNYIHEIINAVYGQG